MRASVSTSRTTGPEAEHVTEGGASAARVAIPTDTGWEIVATQKLKRRSTGEAPLSVWRVEFANKVLGQEVRLDYTVEHAAKIDGDGVVLDRTERYHGGSTCIVKAWTLNAGQDCPPGVPCELLAKYILDGWCQGAYQTDVFDRQGRTETTGLDYLRASGVQALAFKRVSRRTPYMYAKTSMVILMKKLGVGKDMLDCLSSQAGMRIRQTLTPDQFNRVFMRMLARVLFFHVYEGRPILDLKMENMIPIFDSSGRLVDIQIIDYESSLGNRFIFTPSVYSEAMFEQLYNLRRRYETELPLSEFKQLFTADFDVLANGYANMYAHFVDPAAFRLEYPVYTCSDGRKFQISKVTQLKGCPAVARDIFLALQQSPSPLAALAKGVFSQQVTLKSAFLSVYQSMHDWFKGSAVPKPACLHAASRIISSLYLAAGRKRVNPGAPVPTEGGAPAEMQAPIVKQAAR